MCSTTHSCWAGLFWPGAKREMQLRILDRSPQNLEPTESHSVMVTAVFIHGDETSIWTTLRRSGREPRPSVLGMVSFPQAQALGSQPQANLASWSFRSDSLGPVI